MGILDNAIREHLDLKRQHGADDSEVKELEDEAFGAPTRPGDPDFPESQEQPAVGADEPPAGGSGAPRVPEAQEGSEDATALLDTSAPFAQPAVDQPSAPASEAPAPEPPSETALEPTPEPVSEEPVSEPLPIEPAAEPESIERPAPPEADDTEAFYDQAGETELDIDELDLDLDDEDASDLMGEEEPVEPEAALPPEAEPAQPISEEHPIDARETVEHPVEELLADEAGVDLPEPDAPATGEEPFEPAAPETGEEPFEPEAPETGKEPPPEEGGEAESEVDDVLEGTPEFLRDQPEDDELWFEQGEPKDFDF